VLDARLAPLTARADELPGSSVASAPD